MNYDVFISYSSKDKEIAFDVCNMLEAANLICWIAPRNVGGGKKYAREIFEAISQSSIVLFIFSSNSNISSHVESEIDTAFNSGKIIIPFRIDDSPMSPELSYYLNKRHYIDGIPNPESAFLQLKESIVRNIPRLQAEIIKENALDVISKDSGMTIEDLKRTISLEKRASDYESTLDTIDKKGLYSIRQNQDGEVLIAFNVRKGIPDMPKLIIDGKSDTVVLYRHKNSAVNLEKVEERAFAAIKGRDNVIVAELYEDEVIREYRVPVILIQDIEKLF